MNFEEALKRIRAGTATPEEREFVSSRISQAELALSGKKQFDFDEALKHVQDGSATDEEREYVKAQLDEANAAFGDNSCVNAAPVKEASGDDLKKAKKSFKKRYIFIPVCVLLVVIVALGAILGGVFGYAASSAKQNMKFNEAECRSTAVDYVFANQLLLFGEIGLTKNDLRIDDVDRQFRFNSKNLAASSYFYEITVEGHKFVQGNRPYALEIEVELLINTVTGNIEVLKKDIDRD